MYLDIQRINSLRTEDHYGRIEGIVMIPRTTEDQYKRSEGKAAKGCTPVPAVGGVV